MAAVRPAAGEVRSRAHFELGVDPGEVRLDRADGSLARLCCLTTWPNRGWTGPVTDAAEDEHIERKRGLSRSVGAGWPITRRLGCARS